MSIILDLPPELERKLAAEAEQLKLSIAEYALRVLATAGTSATLPQNGADVVNYWQSAGLVGTRPDITDAAGHARQLRQQAEKRERP